MTAYVVFKWPKGSTFPTLVCMYSDKPIVLGKGQFVITVVQRVR